jgi:hypothetical protein
VTGQPHDLCRASRQIEISGIPIEPSVTFIASRPPDGMAGFHSNSSFDIWNHCSAPKIECHEVVLQITTWETTLNSSVICTER